MQKEEMGFNLVQKTFICDNLLKSYAHLNALNTENANARNPGSKFSFTIIEYQLLNTAFLVYLNTYFMCDTWPYDS